MKNKRANMVSMESDTYMGTQLSKKKPVEGVPSVLYVSPSGSISEVETPRDTTTMSTAIEQGISDIEAKQRNSGNSVTLSQRPPTPYPAYIPSSTPGSTTPDMPTTEQNMPTTEQRIPQTGGNPWAAFLMAAQQAAPAAALLGAYTMVKKPSRSSGLGRPSRRRTFRKHTRRN